MAALHKQGNKGFSCLNFPVFETLHQKSEKQTMHINANRNVFTKYTGAGESWIRSHKYKNAKNCEIVVG